MLKRPNYRVLRVDLTRGKISTEQLDDGMVRKYLGGAGFSANLLWQETKADTDPLSEENVLVFSVGPLTATAVSHSSRYTVATLSPETGIWGEGHAGGTWAAALTNAGWFAIVVTGKASRPVYLWVKDDDVKIVDARHVWGMTTFDVDVALKKETEEKASVAAIGPAGEKLVRIANIMSDGVHGKAVGRCGIGAVMGSKNLKAVVVRGTGKAEVFDNEKLKESVGRWFPKTHGWPKGTHDSRFDRVDYYVTHRAAIKNWRVGFFEGFGKKLAEDHQAIGSTPDICPHCRSGCSLSRMLNGRRIDHAEHLIPMGSNCLIDDFPALYKAQELCNGYGIDDITAGDSIAFAMECYEKGLITRDDLGGIDLTWGNAQGMLQLVQQIVNREGFGEVLGEGMLRAIKKIGGCAAEYAMHVKGLPVSLHDPRSSNSYALQNATANRGADHSDGYPWVYRTYKADFGVDYKTINYFLSYLSEKGVKAAGDPFAVEGMGELVARAQDLNNVLDSLVLCWFSALPLSWLKIPDDPSYGGSQPKEWAEYLRWVTGWNDIDENELLHTGERIFNLKRLFNVRRGISRKDDTLPPRLLTHPRGPGGGPAADNLPVLGKMLHEYYIVRGWSEEGIPTPEKLADLEIP